MFSISSSGSTKNTETFLKEMQKQQMFKNLERYGQEGVNALASATPVESGLTAASWRYEIEQKRDSYTISWYNSHVVNGVPIAIILQYGHGTGTGGFVSGRDYINPTLAPIFDKIADKVWKAVSAA